MHILLFKCCLRGTGERKGSSWGWITVTFFMFHASAPSVTLGSWGCAPSTVKETGVEEIEAAQSDSRRAGEKGEGGRERVREAGLTPPLQSCG